VSEQFLNGTSAQYKKAMVAGQQFSKLH